MKIYELPDGRLVVPVAIRSSHSLADSMVIVGREDEEYGRWRAWLRRAGETPVRVQQWPPPAPATIPETRGKRR